MVFGGAGSLAADFEDGMKRGSTGSREHVGCDHVIQQALSRIISGWRLGHRWHDTTHTGQTGQAIQ
jgi:hypothetical protein